MKLLNKLNNLLFIIFLFVSASAFAETKWEVAVIFLDNGLDVTENIKEIQSIPNNPNLSFSLFLEKNLDTLPAFLAQAFKSSGSKKALIIYSHGKGPLGLQNFNTTDLKETIFSHIPHLDLLWFDSCFMANIEFLYEIKELSEYTIASEDSEFTSGMPFQTLDQLPFTNTAQEAALMLGKNFIESYSYIKAGTQRNYVSKSSSTISIFENSKWDILVNNLQLISSKIKILNLNIIKKNYTMEFQELVDLGHYLIAIRTANKEPEFDKLLTSTIRLLNIQSVAQLKSNPRLKIFNPESNSLMVFGFSNWTQGNQADFSTNAIFNQILAHDNFIAGPNKQIWPYKKQNSTYTILTPFAPGINIFNYYFLNMEATKLLSESITLYRTSDFIEIGRDNKNSPLLYSAYTQEIGKKAERYTGLSITFPGTVPSIDYFELTFNQRVHWLSL
jgi:hypothetical protein